MVIRLKDDYIGSVCLGHYQHRPHQVDKIQPLNVTNDMSRS